jgi:hypothetical protein
MVTTILIAFALVAVTVALHAVGLTVLVRSVTKRLNWWLANDWRIVRLLILVASWLILLHFAEIATWGLFYLVSGCLPDPEAALYFSGVTYTTIGYGDVVLPTPWRILAPIEGMTGVLMGGLSASFFFAIVHQVFETHGSKATGRHR